MPPSAQPSSMPPPIPVPAFLSSDEPVHPTNGERNSSAASSESAGGDAAGGGGEEGEVKKEVARLPEVKPGPGGIRRKRSGVLAKRKITWVDDHGVDIAQIKEFEPSDSEDSDEEGDDESPQSCSCVIQ
ncbi:uncharacterized protein LOC9639096 [Selaginella moellendorffii]|nr:uncharacterized protein LOC9639096 [Selaginella moellendorffii]|eukprot:XP_024538245.1 uncharacterized protein LOC9639096 [Selaginella moellendorffii]